MADRSTRLDFILRLNDMVSGPLAKVKLGFSELAEKGQQNIKGMGIGLAGMMGAGVAINQSLQPALEMNRALADVRSLGVAEDALDALNVQSLSALGVQVVARPGDDVRALAAARWVEQQLESV